MSSNSQNVGAELKSVVACAGAAVAAGAGDATKVTGQTINRQGYRSAVLAIGYVMALTADKTLSYAIEIQESADGSSWDTAVELLAATVVKTGASTATEVYEMDLDLSSRKKYVRFNITPDLSHSGTDTVYWAAICTLGGAAVLPAV